MLRELEDGSDHFLHSMEGVTQEEPLSMITYGIGVLPIIQDLWDAHPHIDLPWYAYGAGTGGGFIKILAHFRDL